MIFGSSGRKTIDGNTEIDKKFDGRVGGGTDGGVVGGRQRDTPAR